MIDPDKLAEFLDAFRAGAVIVCAPATRAAVLALAPDDVRDELAARMIAHPWLLAGELWACSPGVTIMRPVGAVAT